MIAKIIQFFKNLFSTKKKEPIIPTPAPIQNPIVETGVEENQFIANVERLFGRMKPNQISGFKFILKKWKESGHQDLRWLAYVYATAWHETAFTMQPIKELGGEEYLRAKRYYPYVGRGYVQLTWDYNYQKYGILNDMQKALDPEFAAYVMIDGMTKGIFTGKKLSDYFNTNMNDPLNARRIINGTDKAAQIAGYYEIFLTALTDANINQRLA